MAIYSDKAGIFIIAVALVLSWTVYSKADVWSIQLQNDIVTGTDEHYTNGMSFYWMSDELKRDDKTVPEEGDYNFILMLFSKASLVDENSDRLSVGFQLGQDIYTPSNTSKEELIEDDIPYAGHLYTRYSLFEWHQQVVTSTYLLLGVVGPVSGAEWSQKTLHRLIGNDEPMGWKHQLQNQATIGIGYSYSQKAGELNFENDTRLDWTNAFGIEVGNFLTACSAGAIVRYGHNYPYELAPDYGISGTTGNGRIVYNSKTDAMGWSLNMGVNFSALAYSLILDSSDEHNITRDTYTYSGLFSFSFFISQFEITFSIHSVRSLTNDPIKPFNWGGLSFSLLT